MKENKYFAFSTDADKKLRGLSNKDFRSVMCAVFDNLRDNVDPDFENYLLFDYYEKVLKTPSYYLSRFDSNSAENGKKGGRPPVQGEEQAKAVPTDEYHEKVRAAVRSQQRKRVYERICEEPFKFCEGASWEDITLYFNDIEGSPSNLREALQTLHKNGLIYFNSKGSKVIIKQSGVASLKKSE